LSLHRCWPKTDSFLKTVVEGWQSTAKGLNSVQEMIIQGIMPWCFTPDFYSSNPEFKDKVAAFVRSRPKQPLDAFMRQSNAVINHNAQLLKPTGIFVAVKLPMVLPLRPFQCFSAHHMPPRRNGLSSQIRDEPAGLRAYPHVNSV
jgi:hypothetical protein